MRTPGQYFHALRRPHARHHELLGAAGHPGRPGLRLSSAGYHLSHSLHMQCVCLRSSCVPNPDRIAR